MVRSVAHPVSNAASTSIPSIARMVALIGPYGSARAPIRASGAEVGEAVLVALLFEEPNPMPIKHCLWRQGLIRSAECRLPLTRVSEELGRKLDGVLRGAGDLDTLTSLPGANILARVLGGGAGAEGTRS